jgi:hypothetical protein
VDRLRGLLVLDRWSVTAYLVSFVVGLVALAWAGRMAAGVNQFEGFRRFHENMNPLSFFYPTASEVVALARESAGAGQTPVIVGGSSITYGWGQGENEIWTQALQQNLGDGFGVVNLAMPFGAPSEYGSVATEALTADGRAPIFVAEVFPTGLVEPDGDRFRYVYWDARLKGLIPPIAERDAMADRPSMRGAAIDEERKDLRLRFLLDRALYFTDLWQALAYHEVFTVWYPTTESTPSFMTPRARTQDPRAIITPDMRYPNDLEERGLESTQTELRAWCEEGPDGSWTIRNDGILDLYRPWLRMHFPEGVRERSLLLVIARSPYYAERLPESARRCWQRYASNFAELLNGAGYRSVYIGGDWTADDYTDRLHPSGAGGRKMAAQLAPLIRQVAGR